MIVIVRVQEVGISGEWMVCRTVYIIAQDVAGMLHTNSWSYEQAMEHQFKNGHQDCLKLQICSS